MKVNYILGMLGVCTVLSGCDKIEMSAETISPEVIVARQLRGFEVMESKGLEITSAWKKKVNFEIKADENVLDRLVQLARDHGVALNISYDVDNVSNLTYRAINKSVLDILEDVCGLCSWKITLSESSVFINRDAPYLHIHDVHLLNSNAKSNIKTGVNIYDKSSSNTNATDSSSSIDTNVNNNIWNEIEMYLQFLITTYKQDRYDTKLAKEEVVEQYKVKREQHPGGPMNGLDVMALERKLIDNQMVDSANTEILGQLATKEDKQKVEADIRVQKDRIADIAFSINRQAGLIILKAPQYVHKEVARYLSSIESKISMQVRFEARIVEVELKDEYETGINWTALTGDASSANNTFSFNTQKTDNGNLGFKFALGDKTNIQSFMNWLQRYGKAHTISKPELTIVQNEIGLFKVVTNNVYFQMSAIETLRAYQGLQSRTVSTSTAQIIPEGFSMSIQSAVDPETGDIMVHIKPSITFVSNWAVDPAVELSKDRNKLPTSAVNIESKYPILSAREFDTKLRLRPGEWSVLGGHVSKRSSNSGEGSPGVKAKYIGALLGTKANSERMHEIVFLIRGFPESTKVKTLKKRLIELYAQRNSLSKLENINV